MFLRSGSFPGLQKSAKRLVGGYAFDHGSNHTSLRIVTVTVKKEEAREAENVGTLPTDVLDKVDVPSTMVVDTLR